MNKCPDCGGNWVAAGSEGTTLVGYSSPVGHNHDDNCRSRLYQCENGHDHVFSIQARCPVEGCDWVGRSECFCHPGAKVADYPEAMVSG